MGTQAVSWEHNLSSTPDAAILDTLTAVLRECLRNSLQQCKCFLSRIVKMSVGLEFQFDCFKFNPTRQCTNRAMSHRCMPPNGWSDRHETIGRLHLSTATVAENERASTLEHLLSSFKKADQQRFYPNRLLKSLQTNTPQTR